MAALVLSVLGIIIVALAGAWVVFKLANSLRTQYYRWQDGRKK